MTTVAAPTQRFHSRPLLAFVVICHVAVAIALVDVLDRARTQLPMPITVTLVAEPVPEELPEQAPEPLPQAPAPRRPPAPPRTVAQPPPPPALPEPPPPLPEPIVQPEPVAPVRQVEQPPAPPAPAPPVQVARPEEPLPAAPPPPEPARTAPPAPVAAAPAPIAASEPVSEPLYGADYLRNPKPTYPLMSRRMGEQGVVLLRVFVTSSGDPREIVLKEGSGFTRLDRAAQEAVQRWKFVPAKRGDRAVDAWVLVPIRFSLKG